MRKLSIMIYWSCNLALIGIPLMMIYSVWVPLFFTDIVKTALNLNIQWGTVENTQWIILWSCMTIYIGIGYAGVYFLRKSFKNFAACNWFDLSNSLNIRIFAKLLMIQSLAMPVFTTLAGLILSFNHPPGQKILNIMFGMNEIKGIVLSSIFLVISHILVVGNSIETENNQFL